MSIPPLTTEERRVYWALKVVLLRHDIAWHHSRLASIVRTLVKELHHEPV